MGGLRIPAPSPPQLGGVGRAPPNAPLLPGGGPGSRGALLSLTGRPELPPPRVLALRRIRDPDTAEPLDRGLVVWFPGGVWRGVSVPGGGVSVPTDGVSVPSGKGLSTW
uniref:Uncharacterized protein n=1 Tax=Otus sunia TaxID=257818 RepID=A0A8C8B665_9STRI